MDDDWIAWKQANRAKIRVMRRACNKGDTKRLMAKLKTVELWMIDFVLEELFDVILDAHNYACLEPLLLFAAANDRITVSDSIRKYLLIEKSIERKSKCIECLVLKSTVFHLNDGRWKWECGTLLWVACVNNNVPAVKLLLKYGTRTKNEIDEIIKYWYTVTHSTYPIIQILLMDGGCVSKNIMHDTPSKTSKQIDAVMSFARNCY